MRQDIIEAPDQTPIIYVLIVLGLLSWLASFPITDLRHESLQVIDVTALGGLICGLCALPLGLKLSNIRPDEARVHGFVIAKISA